ncbi:MAG: substrate-binding domain-containing protein, partial [Lacisediminihabitans sp.]
AGRTVVAELAKAGHRRIGVIGEIPDVEVDPTKSVTVGLRFAAIRESCREFGIQTQTVQLPGWSPSIGHDAALALLREHPDLTALLAGNDNVAFGIYQALSELGRRVPQDVSVISFDDEELAGYLRPGLTTARLPYEEMARIGVEMVLGHREMQDVVVPMPLVHRGSVGAPSDHGHVRGEISG